MQKIVEERQKAESEKFGKEIQLHQKLFSKKFSSEKNKLNREAYQRNYH